MREYLSRHEFKKKEGFQWRAANDISRIEGFSDAVFAFAITLLVVSLAVPKTFEELMAGMHGFVSFAAAFALLFVIWMNQYRWFRQYGPSLWLVKQCMDRRRWDSASGEWRTCADCSGWKRIRTGNHLRLRVYGRIPGIGVIARTCLETAARTGTHPGGIAHYTRDYLGTKFTGAHRSGFSAGGLSPSPYGGGICLLCRGPQHHPQRDLLR